MATARLWVMAVAREEGVWASEGWGFGGGGSRVGSWKCRPKMNWKGEKEHPGMGLEL